MQIKSLFKEYKFRFLLTIVLILAEAGIMLLFPLFIGKAIDGVINESRLGVFQLGGLGLALLIVGVGRRVFDSRFYGKIYEAKGEKMVSRMKYNQSSVKTARLSMMQEFFEFLENALPELINNIIGLVGVVLILFSLNMKVFYGSLVVTIVIFLVYWLTSKKTMDYNEASNNEIERQVDVLAKNDQNALKNHLKQTVKWNIKLSDLEAFNFSVSWVVALAFLVVAIIVSVGDGVVQYGALFALVMYVFQYIENVLSLPLFYQNWLRLQEIMVRLRGS
ncbi:ABC transporter six-transmembrane domain-containing protein [Fulvivirgaceae bacterium BMA12]|uniref:ABC transporter six-transmembrane domain-containing protein n=1 Tax=Agaribacillus aureus TaxID=3051825 RepID=A0ABT8LBI7_9BACT|nr:ABC transporter six-transmembrane domain-containing protein [Fulvivirgaceae bacterium BMA12]